MAKDFLEIRTVLSVEQVKYIFNSTLQPISRKVEFGSVEPSDNPFDEPVDFQAYASLKTFAGGWVVQIYINDHQDARVVTLVPVGSSAFGRAFYGARNTYSRAAGVEKAATVLSALRAADPALQTA